ncbi:DUF2218 domain-containing protein [Halomonas elongata]|uniref:DUF2218 domain-containing protein n=2 Tax=Halomonas elongata TaxID=2746 RepID=E1VAT8_HALED|nr:DUF2218 domain-containing protein [Halomonas elongata]MBW5801833.1 DUF2218 domain-containing protein [Halomonas elongata]MDL4863549.1 DUF2218 domain-containing protein [Halomonas elongata]OBX38308.1 hypothetical protein A8U91_02706 [Halomonas elongata]RAW08100.1 DUF2218 domain-containing protein [Halomonas elongata]WBF17788.1 DUF2218 domain-containing protein [Halomonas elongata]
MPISRAEIVTDSGEKLINRLCKHWSHKLEVEQEGDEGRITFDNGSCLLRAEEGKLKVAVESLDEEGLDRLEGVVASHLERMSGKESLDIIWEN